MTTENRPAVGQDRPEVLDEISFRELAGAFYKSDHFGKSFADGTKKQFALDLKRIVKAMEELKIPSTEGAVHVISKTLKTNSTVYRSALALSHAIHWGVDVGLVDPDIVEKYNLPRVKVRLKNGDETTENKEQPEKPASRERIKKLALSPEKFDELLELSKKKLNQQALIIIIVSTGFNTDQISRLTSENIRDTEHGVYVTIDEHEVEIPEDLAANISEYKKTLKPNQFLFREKSTKTKTGITRQGVHQILIKYRREMEVDTLNHSTLVATGVAYYGTKPINSLYNLDDELRD